MVQLSSADEWQDLPSVVRESLNSWLGSRALSMDHRRWFGAGRTGDLTGLVELVNQGADQAGQFVAKFYRADAAAKVERVVAAYRDAPAAFRPHLATLVERIPLSHGWEGVLLHIAHGDFVTTRPLADLTDDPALAEAYGFVCRSIVADWNVDRSGSPTTLTSGQFLRRILADRTDRGKPMQTWVSERGIDFNGRQATLLRSGWEEPLANPFTLLNSPDVAETPLKSVLLGWAHGDLSARNIYAPRAPLRPEEYVLIDLDRVSEEAPLARDPMHLLVAVAMDYFRDHARHDNGVEVSSVVRREFARVIVDPAATVETSPGRWLREISQAVHRGAVAWAADQRRGYADVWRQQCTLSLVAAGLMHVGRTFFDDVDRHWALDLAALAATRYLSEPSADPYAPGSGKSPEVTRKVGGERVTVDLGRIDSIRVVTLTGSDPDHGRWRESPLRLRQALALADVLVVPAGQSEERGETNGPTELADFMDEARTLADARGVPVFEATDPELGTRLREIASPAHLVNDFQARRIALGEQYEAAEGANKDRFAYRRQVLSSRMLATIARLSPTTTKDERWRDQSVDPGPGSGLLRIAGQPYPVPSEKTLDRSAETAEVLRGLSNREALLLVGPEGVGKTAIVARLLERADERDEDLLVDGFAYLAGYGPLPIHSDSLLGKVAEVAPTEVRDRLRSDMRARRLTVDQKIERLAEDLAEVSALVVLDDLQVLLSDRQEFRDRNMLAVLNALAGETFPGVRLLLVSRTAPAVPRFRSVRVTDSLDPEWAWRLLQAHSGDLLELTTSPEAMAQLYRMTGGRPRSVELVAAVLHGEPQTSLSALSRELAEQAKGLEADRYLLTRALENIDREAQRVLQVAALIGRPVAPAAIDDVLESFLPGLDSRCVLEDLADRHLVRRSSDGYLVPPGTDRQELVDLIDSEDDQDEVPGPGSISRCGLYRHAADHYSIPNYATGDADLARRIVEVEMRIKAGDRSDALLVMDHLDSTVLRPQGNSVMLAHLREALDHENDYLEIHNLSRLADARLQQDDVRPALRDLRRALTLCDDQSRSLTTARILIQYGDAFSQAGNEDLAEMQFEHALEEIDNGLEDAEDAEESHLWRLEECLALAGLARSRTEHGCLVDALDFYAEADSALADVGEPVAERTRTRLLLTLGKIQGHQGLTLDGRRTLRRGYRRAVEVGETLLSGQFLVAQATLCLDVGQPDVAIALADQALEVGVDTNNVPLLREASTTLATAHLCTGDEGREAAVAAARHAVRLLSRSARSFGAQVALGIAIVRRDGPGDESDAAFRFAQERAHGIAAADPENVELNLILGLASCGLGLNGDREELIQAVQLFSAIRSRIDACPGLLVRAQRLLIQLTGLDDPRADEVKSALMGDLGFFV